MNKAYFNDFESLLMRGNIYIVKTHHIYKLVKSGKYYPNNFGKSLLISTKADKGAKIAEYPLMGPVTFRII